MNPEEVYHLLCYTRPSDSQNVQNTETIRKELPEGAGAIWWTKPNDSNFNVARWGTYARSALIAFLLYSLFAEHIDSELLAWIALLLVGYEFAYTNLRREWNEFDKRSADEDYRRKVKKFMKKTYPGFKLP